ncbi:flagellar hook-associated protein FlgK [Crassaminicella thermophila]|uniref:Flagellar hook-associated protein 1 n=1 Tax=Crassaminicella thermophila TaxID=2599308 RepID=A0A5C0SBL5_CRATE|nr:flagellar hook-associated protein FlgK [Crassaminicella thermophila]QEK11307.1 flagellar hook-associated protein FlgK [Crassaminicella thermophila]
MSGSFFGLNIARSGLFASQRALQITGHNIANAGTPGYSRQRLNVNQSNPISLPGGEGMLGTGVDTDNIQQIRDEFLDFKIRQEFVTKGEWEARSESLQQIEAIFNEPSDSGVRKVMDEFFSALHELNKNPDNLTARAQVRERGIALTKTINYMYNQLEDMQENTDFAIETTVNQINGYAKEIAALNEQIIRYELDGSNANDLRDQRNLLIDKLSQLVDIEVQEIPISGSKDGASTLKIMINGSTLVFQEKYNKLELRPREITKNYLDRPNLLEVSWETGTSFSCVSGKLKGLLDIRDNMTGKEKGIPYYMNQLNRFSTTFAAHFNMQHGAGYGLSDSGTGIPFFNGPYLMKVASGYTLSADEKASGYKIITDASGNEYKTKDLNNSGVEFALPTDVVGSKDEEIIRNFEDKNKGFTLIKIDGNWFKTKTINAGNMDISKEIHDSLNNIAAASNADSLGEGLAGDGNNALKLNELRHDVDMFEWGSPDDFFKSVISNLGVDGQEAIRMVDNQQVLINDIDNKRQSISGVSLDEEMSNMIKFQHAYNACARMITTVDEMLDKIINGMGTVGR